MSAPARCAAEGCEQAVTPNPRGRPAIYCSAACREAHQDRDKRIRVEVVPTGRTWSVVLERRKRRVAVAEELTKPRATALADAIRRFLSPRSAGGEAPSDA